MKLILLTAAFAGAECAPSRPVGVAVAGGGYRAAAFGLGVLEALAAQGLPVGEWAWAGNSGGAFALVEARLRPLGLAGEDPPPTLRRKYRNFAGANVNRFWGRGTGYQRRIRREMHTTARPEGPLAQADLRLSGTELMSGRVAWWTPDCPDALLLADRGSLGADPAGGVEWSLAEEPQVVKLDEASEELGRRDGNMAWALSMSSAVVPALPGATVMAEASYTGGLGAPAAALYVAEEQVRTLRLVDGAYSDRFALAPAILGTHSGGHLLVVHALRDLTRTLPETRGRLSNKTAGERLLEAARLPWDQGRLEALGACIAREPCEPDPSSTVTVAGRDLHVVDLSVYRLPVLEPSERRSVDYVAWQLRWLVDATDTDMKFKPRQVWQVRYARAAHVWRETTGSGLEAPRTRRQHQAYLEAAGWLAAWYAWGELPGNAARPELPPLVREALVSNTQPIVSVEPSR